MSSSGRLSSPSRRSATTPNRNYNRTDDDNNSNIDEGGSLIRGYRQPNMNDNNSNTTPMTMNRYQNRQHHQVHSPSLESWRQDQSQEGAFQSRTHPLQNFNHDADEKKSNRSPRMEEKGRHNQNLQQFQQTSSSMSDYETDASRDRDRNYYASYSTHQDQGDYDHHNRLHGGDFKNSSRHQSYTTKYNSLQNEPTFSNMSASQMTPDVAGFFDQTTVASAVSAPRSAKDDDTYDYGDRDEVINDALDEEEDDDDEDDDEDDASQGSLSYEQRKQKMEREREARDAAVAAAKAELDGPFMQQDDVEHYRKAVDTPLGRTAAGVAVAASFGCILLGPVGLLVGAAAVGIGAGYMQIPEEQRQNMSKKATEAVKNAHDSAYVCSEKISNSCALSYRDSGMADHVPVEIETCCTTLAGLDENGMTSADHDESVMESVMDTDAPEATDIDGKEIAGASKGGHDKRKGGTPTHRASWLRDKKGKAVCHRKGLFNTTN